MHFSVVKFKIREAKTLHYKSYLCDIHVGTVFLSFMQFSAKTI